MPTKRVVVSAKCDACHRAVPLDTVAPTATCIWCERVTELSPGRWRWIFDEPPGMAPDGEPILGETAAAGAACVCGVELPEKALAAAFAGKSASVTCASCHRDVPFRAFDKGFSSAESAVVGEGMTAPDEATPLDVPCSSCGAPLTADGRTRTPVCAFCGTRATLTDEAWRALRSSKVFPFTVWTSRAGKPRKPKRSPLVAIVAGVSVVFAALVAGLVFFLTTLHAPSGFGTVNGPCNGAERACSTDKTLELRCDGDKFVPSLSCRGAKGCRLSNDGTAVSCDYTFAAAGDPCNVDDDACSTDGKAMLHCDGSSFSVSMACKGPDGCKVTPHDHDATLSCDDHVAARGDLCKGDHWACAADRKAVLRCQNGAFAPLGTCKGPRGCTITSNPAADTTTIACDSRLANAGDFCNGDEACSEDGKALLRCENGHFAVAERCGGGCSVGSDQLHCRSPSPL